MEDAAAFAAFFEASYASVTAAVRATLGEAPLARDATDEAFARAAERWEIVRAADQPAAWTYRVAVNWAYSWRRKWARRPTRPTEQLDAEHRDVMPDLDLAHQLAVLPLQQRQMLVLRLGFGMSVAETAAVLGVAEGTVKSGVHRAKQRLREDEEVLDGRA
ncbi:sigma-70 family RNA polymerase sigma factor [Nitriliruptoraceae bacterium ZYF776]|nr:sigma-70 family RNA polymerase sigma factor [Profundirhabdus halotolerans]